MCAELISGRTRIEFREFLVGWTLREIKDAFDSANIDCDRNFDPNKSGERRALVEQYYHTLDFTKPADVKQLLDAYADIIKRAERELPSGVDRVEAEQKITHLKDRLAEDGLSYNDGEITPTKPEARVIFNPSLGISEDVRRAISTEIVNRNIDWSGRLSEVEFLAQLYDLENLPSYEPRFSSMSEDIRQRRMYNLDWDNDWVFWDARINLINAADKDFLKFLCLMVHPTVRSEPEEVKKLVSIFNEHLRTDGWELTEGKLIAGRPTYFGRRRTSNTVTLPDSIQAMDILSDEYVRELMDKCDSRLMSGDLDGAVTVARTLLEEILSQLEIRLTGARGEYKGDLIAQFKKVKNLLNMDESRPDLDEGFKKIIQGLISTVDGIRPVRNIMSDSHARARRPVLHHARLVVNTSKTVATFLVESYNYQIEKGLIKNA